jgi:hypothetical protein
VAIQFRSAELLGLEIECSGIPLKPKHGLNGAPSGVGVTRANSGSLYCANPDFLLRGPHQHPRVRLSVKESRMKLANATTLDRKSGVAQWRDLLFLSVHPI